MKENEHNQDQLLTDYLLGKLSPDEETRLEERYAADSSLQDELLSIEDELIECYLQGQLSATEKAQFEARFLSSPRGHQKLAFAKSLMVVAGEHAKLTTGPPKPEATTIFHMQWASRSAGRFLFASLALILLIALGYRITQRIVQNRSAEDPSSPQNLNQSKDAGKTTNPPLKPDSDRPEIPPAPMVASITLKPLARGTNSTPKVKIGSDIRQLQIQLEIDGNRKSYSAKLSNSLGRLLWSGTDLQAEPSATGSILVLGLPAALFNRGEYSILVSPNESSSVPVAEYSFIVQRD